MLALSFCDGAPATSVFGGQLQGSARLEPLGCRGLEADQRHQLHHAQPAQRRRDLRFAEDESDSDSGGDFKLCVERPGPFKRINTADYSCRDGDLLEGFGEIDAVGLAKRTVNYNP